ncbi:MAG: hypothetical protein ABI411_12740 [Tahibacter sp.]
MNLSTGVRMVRTVGAKACADLADYARAVAMRQFDPGCAGVLYGGVGKD